MKKVFFTYLFISIYALGLFKTSMPVVDYVLNYDYIAKILCINKEEPTSTCNGKCHVAKEIEKNEQSNGDHTTITKFEVELYTLLNVKPTIIDNTNQIDKTNLVLFDPNFHYQDFTFSIFHPPQNS